jgi:hypothetical protein
LKNTFGREEARFNEVLKGFTKRNCRAVEKPREVNVAAKKLGSIKNKTRGKTLEHNPGTNCKTVTFKI